jgi:hypothetical protein
MSERVEFEALMRDMGVKHESYEWGQHRVVWESARRTVSGQEAAFKPVGRCECAFSLDECEVCEANREAYQEHLAENAAPQHSADIDAMRLDAERYRWIRQGKTLWVKVPVRDKHVEYFIGAKPETAFPEQLDAAIDAALQATGVAN